MPLEVGKTAGPYRVVEQLGQGGMATVFKAYHAALDRYVAIKVMHPAFKADGTFLARFQREARVVARLEHPSIVPVYDYAEYEGAPYLVMKFIAGETLKERMARGPLTVDEVLRVIEAVGAALEYAHGQGVLHRDVKPSNIMLAADGTVYLTDFGLARMVQAGESTLSSDSLLGTPTYMSPEQARGDKELDAGTDIYSLGVVVYELLVGRVPFSADTPYAVIHDHIYTPLLLPRQLNPDVPEAAEAVLTRALAKNRGDRYATVGEMVADLKAALAQTPAAGETRLASRLAGAPAPTRTAAPDAATPNAAAASLTRVASDPLPPLAPLSAPAPAAPAGSVAPGKSGARLQWWQVALGLVAIGGFCLLALAAANLVRRHNLAGTETAVAALPTVAVIVKPTGATAVPSATAKPSPSAVETPISTAAEQHLQAAQAAFAAGQPDAALAQLDQAVAVNPNDTSVLLQAGDMTLAQKLAVDSLQHFYLAGLKLETSTPDARAGALGSHAALGLYVAAADQQSGSFLTALAGQYPQKPVLQIAQERYQVFFGGGQGVPAQLNGITKNTVEDSLAGLVLGDYYLARSQLAEAVRQYTPVSALRLGNGTVPDWVIREARCDLDDIRNQRASAKLEASCVDLSSLLTGK